MRRLAVSALALVTLVVLAVPAGAAQPPPWTAFQGGALRTGHNPAEQVLTAATVGSAHVVWQQPSATTALYTGSVAVVGGAVFGVGHTSAGDGVFALDEATGAVRWRAVPSAGSAIETPAVTDGQVLVVSTETSGRNRHSYLFSFDASTGAELWHKRLPSLAYGSPAVSGTLALVTSAGWLTAVRIKTGGIVWSTPLPGSSTSSSSPAVANGTVVVGVAGTDVVAFDLHTGNQLWRKTFGSGEGSSQENWLPAIRAGVVYAGLLDGVAAMDLTTGHVAWHSPAGADSVFFPLAVTRDLVIAPSDSGDRMVALRISDGSIAWQLDPSGQIAGVVVAADLIWGIRSNGVPGGDLVAVRLNTGAVTFSLSLGDVLAGMPPAVVDGRVFVNDGGSVRAVGL
jgi:outer membrane protein assembly factor BamB